MACSASWWASCEVGEGGTSFAVPTRRGRSGVFCSSQTLPSRV
ncbi:unnamed protein product [Ectocarpus sp. 6 AP-2014]